MPVKASLSNSSGSCVSINAPPFAFFIGPFPLAAFGKQRKRKYAKDEHLIRPQVASSDAQPQPGGKRFQ